jgi:4'-phosphopantetheinyl transferase
MKVQFAVLSFEAEERPAFVERWGRAEDVRIGKGRGQPASLFARAALRALLQAATGRSDWTILAGPDGKPWIAGGPAISLSHTRGHVAVAAAATGDLGIDVERHRRRDIVGLAERAFGPTERQAVGDDPRAFYRIWTLREAMAKASGAGLREAADGQDRILGGPFEGCWPSGGWHLAHVLIAPACSLAIAHRAAGPDPWTIERVMFD